MHAIERELIKVTGYKSRAKFDDRQDYLSSILNAVGKLTDDDFDNLSDEAAAWANAAVEAKNSRNQELPDFDEVDPEEASEDDEAEEDAESEDETEEDADDESAEDDSEAEEDSEDDGTDSAADDGADDAADSDSDDGVPEDDEPEEKPAKKASKKAPVKKVEAKPEKAQVKKPERRPPPRRGASSDDDVILDKWGCMEGSKNSQALALFEKGATTKDVKDAIGGTYYNILKKMVKDGHKMDKKGAMITLVHKDAVNKKATPAKAAPAKKAKK